MKKSTLIMILVLINLLLIILAGCAPENVVQHSSSVENTTIDSRIVVTSSTRYTDARGDDRFILVIKDNNTGEEFLAVEGAGTQRMHQECHSVGKTIVCNYVEK